MGLILSGDIRSEITRIACEQLLQRSFTALVNGNVDENKNALTELFSQLNDAKYKLSVWRRRQLFNAFFTGLRRLAAHSPSTGIELARSLYEQAGGANSIPSTWHGFCATLLDVVETHKSVCEPEVLFKALFRINIRYRAGRVKSVFRQVAKECAERDVDRTFTELVSASLIDSEKNPSEWRSHHFDALILETLKGLHHTMLRRDIAQGSISDALVSADMPSWRALCAALEKAKGVSDNGDVVNWLELLQQRTRQEVSQHDAYAASKLSDSKWQPAAMGALYRAAGGGAEVSEQNCVSALGRMTASEYYTRLNGRHPLRRLGRWFADTISLTVSKIKYDL